MLLLTLWTINIHIHQMSSVGVNFFIHTRLKRVWKNARPPNNEKQKRLLWDKNGQSDICLCSIRFLQLTSFSIQGLIFFLGTDICLLTYVDLKLSSLS